MWDLKLQKVSSFNCEIFFTVCSLVTSSVIEEKMNNFALNSFGWCLTCCHTKIVIKPSSILQFDYRPSAVTIEQPGCIGDDRLNCGVCFKSSLACHTVSPIYLHCFCTYIQCWRLCRRQNNSIRSHASSSKFCGVANTTRIQFAIPNAAPAQAKWAPAFVRWPQNYDVLYDSLFKPITTTRDSLTASSWAVMRHSMSQVCSFSFQKQWGSWPKDFADTDY